MNLEPGDNIDGRYSVEALLGKGGMATVYRVQHRQLGTHHALKVLSLPTKAIQDRLIQEGRVQAALKHPNIVSVTDIVDVDGAPGLVMEYVPGPPLDVFLKHQQLSLDQADTLARGILSAVRAAHKLGLIHRDLKPANVLLNLDETGLAPKVTDFGLAKLLSAESGSGSTRSGMAMGTPAYMAPEQVRDAKSVDARADVFSLGAVLFELLTGERAFEGSDTYELFTAVTHGRHRPIPDGIPGRMRHAIEAALSVDPNERPSSAEDLLQLWTADTPPPMVREEVWSVADLERAQSLSSGSWEAPAFDPTPIDNTDATFMMGEEESPLPPALTPIRDPSSHTFQATGFDLSTEEVAKAAPEPEPSRPMAPPPSPTEGSRAAGVPQAVWWLAALGLFLLGGAAMFSVFSTAPEPTTVAAEAPTAPVPAVTTAEPAPEAPAEPGADEEPEPEATEPETPPEAPPARPVRRDPTPAPPPQVDPDAGTAIEAEPEPEPEPVAAEPEDPGLWAEVTIDSSERARLRDSQGKLHDPGRLPPGTYDVLVFYETGKPTKTLQIELKAGDRRAIRCASAMRACR